MYKFKLGILTFVLLGFIACKKDENSSPNDDKDKIVEETFTEPLIKEATSATEGDNGILIKIVGLGFGARLTKDDANEPYAPLLSSDFEYDNSGNPTQIGQPVVESLSEWADGGPVQPEVDYERRAIFSEEARNSELTNNRSAKMTHIKTSEKRASPLLVAQNLDFKKGGKIFFSYWVKIKSPNESKNISYIYKLSTVVTDCSSDGLVPGGAGMQFTNWVFPSDDGPSYTGFSYTNMNDVSGSNLVSFPGNPLGTTTNNWRNIVLFWDPGTPDKLDGKFWSWISENVGTPLAQKGGLESFLDGDTPMISTYDASISDFPNSIKLAWDISKLSDWNVDFYFDDVVADNSWAQVFVGDKPNFDDCSILEIQQVVDWQAGKNGADDIAQFKLRYGSLAKNEALYVYIMNEGGLFNRAGYSVHVD